jgi:hypothetical protein
VRTAVFKPASEVVGYLFQQRANRIDAAYQPKVGEVRKSHEAVLVQCIFGPLPRCSVTITTMQAKSRGIIRRMPLWVWKALNTPALARLICLEGADETSYQKAEEHLAATGGIDSSARQIQRVVQRVEPEAQNGKSANLFQRKALPIRCLRSTSALMARAQAHPCAKKNWRAEPAANPASAPKRVRSI